MTRPFVFDIHHHVGSLFEMVGPEGTASTGAVADRVLEDDLDIRLRYMDRYGIDQALVMPSNGAPAPNGFTDRAAENDRVARYRALAPDRFPAALGSVSPLDGALALEEIDRCVEELGMRGIVWHHRFMGTALNHAAMYQLLERVEQHGVLAFVHIIAGSTLESPWRLEVLAEQFPNVSFVALDGFSSADHAQWMPHLARRHRNISFDTGMMLSVAHFADRFAQLDGGERLCFGSDFYSSPKLFERPFGLDELTASDLPEKVLARVLGLNALELLGLPEP